MASETYFETLVGFLATRDVLSCVGDDDDGDLVVVPAEELLCSANNVSDYDRGAQREDDVLVVRMQNQSPVYLACREEMSQISACLQHLPLKPITAYKSSSVDTILPLLSLKSFAFSFLHENDFNTLHQLAPFLAHLRLSTP